MIFSRSSSSWTGLLSKNSTAKIVPDHAGCDSCINKCEKWHDADQFQEEDLPTNALAYRFVDLSKAEEDYLRVGVSQIESIVFGFLEFAIECVVEDARAGTRKVLVDGERGLLGCDLYYDDHVADAFPG
jgi:hypothetical protein